MMKGHVHPDPDQLPAILRALAPGAVREARGRLGAPSALPPVVCAPWQRSLRCHAASALQEALGAGVVPHAAGSSGKAGIANAKLACRDFEELVASARWAGLVLRGGRPQRVDARRTRLGAPAAH